MRRRARILPPNVIHLRDRQRAPVSEAATITGDRPAVIDFATWRDRLRPPPPKELTLLEVMQAMIARYANRPDGTPAA